MIKKIQKAILTDVFNNREAFSFHCIGKPRCMAEREEKVSECPWCYRVYESDERGQQELESNYYNMCFN